MSIDFLTTISGASTQSFYGFSSSLSSNKILTLSTRSDNDLGQVETYDLDGLLNTHSSTVSEFKIYPNPASTTLNLKLNNHTEIESISILSLQGKRIKKYTDHLTLIDVSFLSNGIYFIEITSGHKNYMTKFVKK